MRSNIPEFTSAVQTGTLFVDSQFENHNRQITEKILFQTRVLKLTIDRNEENFVRIARALEGNSLNHVTFTKVTKF